MVCISIIYKRIEEISAIRKQEREKSVFGEANVSFFFLFLHA